MGPWLRLSGDRSRVTPAKAGFSWQRCRGSEKSAHRLKAYWLGGAWKADLVSLFGWRIARNPSRDEWTATRGSRRIFARQTRSSGVVPARAVPGLFRSPD